MCHSSTALQFLFERDNGNSCMLLYKYLNDLGILRKLIDLIEFTTQRKQNACVEETATQLTLI